MLPVVKEYPRSGMDGNMAGDLIKILPIQVHTRTVSCRKKGGGTHIQRGGGGGGKNYF
jgi:hypothetical protein